MTVVYFFSSLLKKIFFFNYSVSCRWLNFANIYPPFSNLSQNVSSFIMTSYCLLLQTSQLFPHNFSLLICCSIHSTVVTLLDFVPGSFAVVNVVAVVETLYWRSLLSGSQVSAPQTVATYTTSHSSTPDSEHQLWRRSDTLVKRKM